jgi:hypothetical protein
MHIDERLLAVALGGIVMNFFAPMLLVNRLPIAEN